MDIIVLGAGGQLGREWLQLPEKDGVNVKGFTHGDLDITDANSTERVLRELNPDLVVNCAAFTDVDGAEELKTEAEKVNATAVDALARRCAAQEVMLVHFSTDYAFAGNTEDRIRFPGGYPEDHTTDPVNWYGETKLRGERAIRKSGVPHLIIRTSWLCSRYGSNFVKTMVRLAGVKDQINVVNDQWGSPSFGKNVVYNTFNLVRKQKEGTFHVTSEGLITWFELAREIFDITGKDVIVNPVPSGNLPTKAARPLYSKLSNEKLRGVKDAEIWEWKEGLRRLLKQLEIR